MEKISTVFKKTQTVLREKMRSKRLGHRRDQNSTTQVAEEKTGTSPDTVGQKGRRLSRSLGLDC